MQGTTVGFIHTNNYKGISGIVTQEAKKGVIFLHVLFPHAYVLPRRLKRKRILKIPRKAINIWQWLSAREWFMSARCSGSPLRPASQRWVLLWSRGAAHSVIGLVGNWSTWKKSRCHLVTLGHAANCCQGVLEQASCQGRVMNDCAPSLCPLTSPTSPSCLSHHLSHH